MLNANRLLSLVCLVGVALGGIACTSWQKGYAEQPVALQKAEADALRCGEQTVQSELTHLEPSVLDALAGDSTDWRSQLDGLKSGGDMRGVMEAGLERTVEERLLLADAGDAPPLPTPTRRILARGLSYLRAEIPDLARSTK